ncbi:MAG: hypothetical protein R2729_06920 [Bryobacteraceae bacterium]
MVHTVLPLLAIEILTGFQPAAETPYGPASQVEFSTRQVEVEAGLLAHHAAGAMKDLRFSEKVWVIGYKTTIVDANGAAPKENYLCHTFFSDQRVDQHQENELKGIYSDAFTPEVALPEGFGIPIGPGDRLHWMPMFNNRGDTSTRVAMKAVLTVIRDRDLRKPLTPLYASLRSVQVPHLYFVPPGGDQREATFELAFDGRIHFLGTHLHPYGASIELFNVTRNEVVWQGRRKEPRPDGPMQTFSSPSGYPVRAGETYRIRAVYENPGKDPVDAMAGLFMLYSRSR